MRENDLFDARRKKFFSVLCDGHETAFKGRKMREEVNTEFTPSLVCLLPRKREKKKQGDDGGETNNASLTLFFSQEGSASEGGEKRRNKQQQLSL